MSEEIKTEIEEEVVELTPAGEAKAALQAMMEDDSEVKPAEEETDEAKEARIEAEKKLENETDEERVAREKLEADAATEEARVAALTDEEKEAEKEDVKAKAEKAVEEKKEEHPEHPAWMRNKLKKEKELRETAEKRLADLEKKPDPQGDTAEKAVGKLVKVWASGEGDEAPLLGSIRKASTPELIAINNKALAGDYGDHNEDVIKAVSAAMPMVNAREVQAGAEAKVKQDALVKDYEAEVEQAKADYPDYADGESDASKAMVSFDKKFLGTLDPKTGKPDGTGALPDDLALYIQTHPYVHHQLADDRFRSSLTNSDSSKATVAALTKERDDLSKRLKKYETLEAPPTPTSTDVVKTGTAAESKAKLEALFRESA